MSNENDVPILDTDIENSEMLRHTSDTQCAICLDVIDEHMQCINNCGHSFCKPCIDLLFDTGNTSCPLCRQPIQYFVHNSEKFRLIIKGATPTTRPDNRPANRPVNNALVNNALVIERRNHKSLRIMFSSLLFLLGLQVMYTNSVENHYNELSIMYQACTLNNTMLEALINNNNKYIAIPV